MGLEWLAAVLQPFDVLPDIVDEPETVSGPQRVAVMVTGENWRLGRSVGSSEDSAIAPEEPDTPEIIAQCLDAEHQLDGLRAATRRLSGGFAMDPSEATALALIACASAAEVEEYATCFQSLARAEALVEGKEGPEYLLILAAIRAQRSLRLLDTSAPYLEDHIQLVGLLAGLEGAPVADYPVRVSAGKTPSGTFDQMRRTLLDAVISLIPRRLEAELDSGVQAAISASLASPPTDMSWRTAEMRGDSYRRFVKIQFERKFDSRTVHIGGSGEPDLFYPALHAELCANQKVFAFRQELAQLRLVLSTDSPEQTGDALRSLRQAADYSDLDLVVRHLMDGGPVEALALDAQKILRNEARRYSLRTVEARVLDGAADFLSKIDAEEGLRSVAGTLTGDGPPNLPFRWQLEILRRQALWQAGGALAQTADQIEEWAQILLTDAGNRPEDADSLDDALFRALRKIMWDKLSDASKSQWLEFVDRAERPLPDCSSLVHEQLGLLAVTTEGADTLGSVVSALNTAFRGGTFPVSQLDAAVQTLNTQMDSIAEDARRGAFGFGGIEPADVAVGVAIVSERGLWPRLVDFLVDENVGQHNKRGAFERLARWPGPLRAEERGVFSEAALGLLRSVDRSFFEGPTLHVFPAALRFLSRHGLISEQVSLQMIATLAGSDNQSARMEAALTLGLLAHFNPSEVFLSYSLTLSLDSASSVRAAAGRALAALTRLGTETAAVAENRLIELLDEQGVLVPSIILTGLSESNAPLREDTIFKLIVLSDTHPAHSVRAKADDLLRLR